MAPPARRLLALLGPWVVLGHDQDSAPKDPLMTKHVLWPAATPRPDAEAYASWYKSSDLDWVSKASLPQVDPAAKVNVFWVTKPVYWLVGRTTGIWHGGLGFRVEGGASYMYEYSSLDFEAAIVYPMKNKSDPSSILHFPSTSIVDYHYDPSGKTLPVTGKAWRYEVPIGETTGRGLNLFAAWALDYGERFPRYLVWRAVEVGTERTLLDSQQCFDFVFRGLQYLRNDAAASINATSLTRTMVNLYVSSVEEVSFSDAVNKFFSSEASVMLEWFELSGEAWFENHSPLWYWPAWYTTTDHPNGTASLVNDDYPRTYHKYNLKWPSSTSSKAMREGVQHLAYPIFPESVSRAEPAIVV